MQVGVFAKTFAGTDPHGVLTTCKKAGFQLAQYNMACSGLGPLPDWISNETVTQIIDAAEASEVEIAAFSATYNMIDPDIARRDAGRRGFAAIADAAARLGTKMVTVCSGTKNAHNQWRGHPDNDAPIVWSEMCREFEFALRLAEQHDVLIGVEPEQANVVSSSRKAVRLLDEFSDSRLRIVLDPANILEGIPPEAQYAVIDEALDLLGPYIEMAHAKDRHADGSVAPAGQGTVDWSFFLRGLSRAGFDGPLIAHGMSANDAPTVASFLAAELNRL